MRCKVRYRIKAAAKIFRNIAILIALTFAPRFAMANGTLVMEAVGAHHLYDEEVKDPLAKGCLVQVVLDRDGDGLDPIEGTGSIYPAGDDVLLPVVEGESIFRVGDGLPPFEPAGHFSAVLVVDNESPGENWTGYRIYIRFWNSPGPGPGSFFGEAGPFVIESGLKPQRINILEGKDLSPDRRAP